MTGPEDQLDPSAYALVTDDQVPAWLRPVIRRSLDGPLPGLLDRAARRRQAGNRQSAVLMLLGEGPTGPDLLLTQRASTLRTHAGQPAFPGGAIDPGEDAVAAALREGQEETGVDPSSVQPLVLMPRLYLPASEFVVQPVLAYWRNPGPVRAVDPAETATVARVPIDTLADPANRVKVRLGDFEGPGFRVADMLVWGFTAFLVEALLQLGGWEIAWEFDHTTVVELARP
jgi:8-oxo-dGTP pyrophosphatase MutT (NUDIX family)